MASGKHGAFTVNQGVDLAHENPTIAKALKALAAAGYNVDVTSGFRSYGQQQQLYDRYKNSGFNIRYIAAKPGQSNHETGRAADVYVNGSPVDQTPAALAFLKQYGLYADVPGDHEHLDYRGQGGAAPSVASTLAGSQHASPARAPAPRSPQGQPSPIVQQLAQTAAPKAAPAPEDFTPKLLGALANANGNYGAFYQMLSNALRAQR